MDVGRNIQSVLHPAGPHAEAVATLSWVLIWGAAAVLFIVLAIAAIAVWAPKRWRAWTVNTRFIVGGGVVFPVVVLSALLVYTLVLARGIVGPADPSALRIEVIGEQWWWRVRYLDAGGNLDFVSANELRIPAGAPVELTLKSDDVIHSFWVPNLAGKIDMIPGRTTRLAVQAQRPGVFRGQCAEYCGGPHAKMAFYVIAEAPQAFAAWRERQRGIAKDAVTDAARKGRALFLSHCSTCHTVRGTEAAGTLGPDLTHLAGRMSLAAGILPNDTVMLARWIDSSQQLKPGNLMPSMDVFSADELSALVAYLGSLE